MDAVARHAWERGAFKIMLLTNQSRGVCAFYETLGDTGNEKHGMVLRNPARRKRVASNRAHQQANGQDNNNCACKQLNHRCDLGKAWRSIHPCQ